MAAAVLSSALLMTGCGSTVGIRTAAQNRPRLRHSGEQVRILPDFSRRGSESGIG